MDIAKDVVIMTQYRISKQIASVIVITEFNYFLEFLCACYLVGGLTIGYYFCAWRNKSKKTGMGRWDYKDRHL